MATRTNRSSREILADMLRACKDAAVSKTSLYQVAKMQTKYIDLLIDRGLLEQAREGGYQITGRGREFLAAVDYAEGMLVEVRR